MEGLEERSRCKGCHFREKVCYKKLQAVYQQNSSAIWAFCQENVLKFEYLLKNCIHKGIL
ncbi:hypothetical protein SK128_026411, partial [Halocaridina rubra]